LDEYDDGGCDEILIILTSCNPDSPTIDRETSARTIIRNMLASHAKQKWTEHVLRAGYTFNPEQDPKDSLCQNCDFIKYGAPDTRADLKARSRKMEAMVKTFFDDSNAKEWSVWKSWFGRGDYTKTGDEELVKLSDLLVNMQEATGVIFLDEFIKSFDTTYEEYIKLKRVLHPDPPVGKTGGGGYLRNKRKSRNRKSNRMTQKRNKGKRKKTGRSKMRKRSKRSRRSRRSKRRNSRRMKRRSR
jgi:hypothetical protein